jgi:ubiquinone biosynthesis protein COQ4
MFQPQSEAGVRQRSLIDAFQALSVLMRDPNDTAQGFRLVEALDPHIHHRELARMRSEPTGERLLREQPALVNLLRDRAALASMPAGSLGRAYLDFCVQEGIEADVFVQIGEAGSQSIEDAQVRYAAHRSRDSHDVWHVVCGFRSDMAGEAAILGFTFAQTRSPGLLLLLAGGFLHSLIVGRTAGKTMRRLAWFGWKSGKRARPLAAAPWEEWLARPLHEIRSDLRVFDVPVYEPAYAPRGEAAAGVRIARLFDRALSVVKPSAASSAR